MTTKKKSRVSSEEPAEYLETAKLSSSDMAVVEKAKKILAGIMASGQPITDPSIAENYCITHFSLDKKEKFAVIFLDTRHRVLAIETLFTGTIDGAEVHPREVVCAALRHHAAAVILTHNHPSGDPQESHADMVVTKRLKEALQLIEVRVLDHFIVAAGTATSFARKGLL